MKRTSFSTATMVAFAGLLIIAVAAWGPSKVSVSPPAPTPSTPAWVPITLGMAMMLTDYSDREDWTGCETRGVSPLHVRCPDGYTLEIR